ncbi:MAG: tRNA (pseudouridine(54)-N(1))-methyltransferase TrmY [Halobacteriales archaeon]
MRTFVAVAHTAPLDPTFSLDDLPGGAGRLDVLCRYVTAAFLLSHGIREDVRVVVVIRDELAIEFRGDELRHLNPDERSTAALFRKALEVADDRVVGAYPVESTPGIAVSRRDLAAVLDDLEGTVVRLHHAGEAMGVAAVPDRPCFVLSDHRDLTPTEATLVDGVADRTVSLGPEALHGNHAIAVAHNRCDLAAAESTDSGSPSA